MGKREDYIDKLAAQLKVWGAEIDVWKAKAEKETVDGKIAILKEVEILNKEMQNAQNKLKEINEKANDAWESLVQGADKAWDNLREAVHQAGEKFK
jgi:predicted  nucleic acid-binding Zn-ribbon protein